MNLPTEDQPPLPVVARLLRLLLLLLAFAAGLVAFGLWMAWDTPFFQPADEPATDLAGAILTSVLLCFIAVAGFTAAAGAYLVMRSTAALTWNYQRPVWRGVNQRLKWIDALMTLVFFGAVGALMAAVFMPVLMAFGVTVSWGILIVLLTLAPVLTSIQTQIDPWAPVQRAVTSKRLAVRGVAVPQGASAYYAGVSDPPQGKDKQQGRYREQDVGVIMLDGNRLQYIGDDRAFEIPAAQITSIVRYVEKKEISSLFGGRGIAVHWVDDAGQPQAIRVYCTGTMLVLNLVRSYDRLADVLKQWHLEHSRAAVLSASHQPQASPLGA